MADVDFKRLSRDMAGREGVGSSLIMITIATLLGLALIWASWAVAVGGMLQSSWLEKQ